MPKWTGKKSSVFFSKPEEPSFLKKFKEKVGYKEDSGLQDKFEKMPKATDEDLEDSDDELPQVVQLQEGDLSQDEYHTLIGKEEKKKDELDAGDGKIVFRKPEGKRSLAEKNQLMSSTKKKKGEEDKEDRKGEKKGEEDKEKKKKKKEESNRKLLSFDEDEAEDST